MKKHSLFLSWSTALFAATLAAHGQQAHSYSSSPRQSSAEVEDIGAIGEGDFKSGDSKNTPPPEKISPFRFNAGIRTSYTSNARLSGNHASNDFLVFPSIEAGYHTALGKGFAFDALGRVESGVYANHDERAFIGYSLTTTLEWRLKPNLPRVYIGVEPYRYDGFDGQGRITSAVGTSAGTDWGYGFNNGNSLFYVGYSYTDYFSDPEKDNRLTHTATVGLTQVIKKNLVMQAYYQYVHEFYPDADDRNDSRHVVGLNLTYQFSQHLFSTLGASFVDSDSTQSRGSYQSTGVSFGVNYQF